MALAILASNSSKLIGFVIMLVNPLCWACCCSLIAVLTAIPNMGTYLVFVFDLNMRKRPKASSSGSDRLMIMVSGFVFWVKLIASPEV